MSIRSSPKSHPNREDHVLAILVTIFVIVLIGGLLYWLVSMLTLPEPFKQLAVGVVLIGTILFIIVELWTMRGLLPHGP